MQKKIELPLVKPLYSAYHYQGHATAVLAQNLSIQNRYFNEVLMLTCTKKFLKGFTTPELGLAESSWEDNPYLEKKCYPMQFLGGYVHAVIRNLLEGGYYVCFTGIDDYYVQGKSWYRQRHFCHDGCICGYDQEAKTYSIYAYDYNWIYQKFKTPQKCFDAGRRSMFRTGQYGEVCGIKPRGDRVAFSAETALKKIAAYLDSAIEKYPEETEGIVCGIAVQDYMAKYMELLARGFIPYEKMDRRIFRLLWEHKSVMLQRIQYIEQMLAFDDAISKPYRQIVSAADACRMLYAAHAIKQRNTVLPVIQKRLESLRRGEGELLEKLLQKAGFAIGTEGGKCR